MLVGVGVAVPGLVRQRDGFVRLAPNLGWVDVPLGELLATALGVSTPVIVGNDADFGAMAEHVRGSAMVPPTSSTSPVRSVSVAASSSTARAMGAQGYAGEVGHMVVNPKGRPCRCGAVGCLETEVGEPAVRSPQASRTPPRSARSWPGQAGDRDALDGLRRIGDWLGIGVTNLVNIFNPAVVIFGGTLQHLLPLHATESNRRCTARSPHLGST